MSISAVKRTTAFAVSSSTVATTTATSDEIDTRYRKNIGALVKYTPHAGTPADTLTLQAYDGINLTWFDLCWTSREDMNATEGTSHGLTSTAASAIALAGTALRMALKYDNIPWEKVRLRHIKSADARTISLQAVVYSKE